MEDEDDDEIPLEMEVFGGFVNVHMLLLKDLFYFYIKVLSFFL